MQQQASIISYCGISNNSVYKDGEQTSYHVESMQQFFAQLYRDLTIDYPKFYKMDNLSKLGFLTTEYLLKDLLPDQQLNDETALVLSNANASLDSDMKYFHSIEEMASPALFVYTLPNIVIGEICIRNKFKSNGAFFVSETFNATFTAYYVNDIFKNSNTQHCICGWVDVLDETYKAVLFLVSAKNANDKLLFNETNMQRIFESV